MNDNFYKRLNRESPTEQPEKRLKENKQKEKRVAELIIEEEALRSKQRQLTDIIEFLPDATLAIDKERHVIIWNKAIEKMTGILATEMIGKGDYAYAIPFYGKAQPQLMDLVFLNDEEIATRYPNLTREGDSLTAEVFCSALYNNKGAWVFAKASSLHDQAGNIIGAIESIRDITEHKQAEEEILESKNFLEILLESIPAPVFYKDINGRYLGFNKAFEDFFGKTKDELIGKNVFDINPLNLARIYHAKDAELFKQPGTQIYETQVKDAQGVLHDVVFYKAIMTNSHGKVTGLIGTVLDITDRIQLETALSNEKNLLETTLKSVGDGVISTDYNGNIVFLNNVGEGLTGWTQVEANGKAIEEIFNIVNEFTGEKSDNFVKKVFESRKKVELANHNLLISKDGNQRPIENSAAPILEESGEILGVVVVFRDFSEKMQKEEEILYLSYHDYLTGLYNRRFYEEAITRLDTTINLPLTIVMGDVNGLKLINDSFGHAKGDELLQKAAKMITEGCRADDIVARLGGDEFIVILPRTDVFEAVEITERMRASTSKEKIGNFNISISFGYETKENEEENIQEIFLKAEDDMYRHKQYESARTRTKTIDLIINTLYEKSHQEMLHSKRVSEICEAIAVKMNFDQEAVNQIRIAGCMHDIGKMVIDEKILNKPEKLDPEEWKEMQRHPEIGFRILSSVSEFSEMANYVFEHHERWNGKGYPKGLKDQEILLQARIIGVAEAYDAMTSDRTYGKVLSEEEAITEIRRCSGAQFDPEIARVFVEKVMGKKW